MGIEIRTVGQRKKYYLSSSYRRDGKVMKARIFLGTNLTEAELNRRTLGASGKLKSKMAQKHLPKRHKDIKLIGFDSRLAHECII